MTLFTVTCAAVALLVVYLAARLGGTAAKLRSAETACREWERLCNERHDEIVELLTQRTQLDLENKKMRRLLAGTTASINAVIRDIDRKKGGAQ
jgi:regulator of replication initiation timing